MARTLVDYVKVYATNTGTGPLQLGAAVPGFDGIGALTDAATYGYSIRQGSNYEVGSGVYSLSGGTLTRVVEKSSNGGEPINLSPNAIVNFPALAADISRPGPVGPQGPQGIQGPAGPGGADPALVMYKANNLADVADPILSRDNIGAAAAGLATASGLELAVAARILGRTSAGIGPMEELTLTQVLDMVGSAAQGDFLFRGASGWARLAAGTSGQVLTTQGAGADPLWLAAAHTADSRTTLAALPAALAAVWLSEAGREGMFAWKTGDYTAAVASDTYQGLYVPSTLSGSGVTVGCWVRVWDGISALPEWFGVVPNSSGAAAANDLRIAACYALAPKSQFGPNDYWHSATIKANIEGHGIYGVGEKYTGVNTAVTRFVCTSGSVTLCQQGADTYPGSINAMPQNIDIESCYFARSVAPVISSNCIGLSQQFCLNSVARNVKTDGNMIGIQANGVVHTFQINCESVRATAGSGAGTDYFIGNYANGGGSIGAAGGNASLYIINCSAGCNYGPLQTVTGAVGFKADQGFTDVWYWNPETVNFYWAQQVLGNDSAALVFSNTDFTIFHPIHDQFHNAGIYVTDVASAGSVAIVEPYYGPGSGARAAYWVNSSEGAVASRGGQFVMGANASCQAILLMSSRGTDVLDYPQILEHGNIWPIVSVADVNDARIDVFAKNPTVTAGAFVLVSGTCVNVTGAIKSSGKASAFQYGYQLLGTNIHRSTFDVSGINSDNLPSVNRKLDNNGTPITAAGVFATDCLGQGNFA